MSVDVKAVRFALSAAAVCALFALSVSAQQNSHSGFHGVPPSVTSFGFGGHPGFHGVPPSVTSFHFGSVPGPTHPPFVHRRHHGEFANPFYGSVYYVPYAVPYDYSDYVTSAGVDDTMEQPYATPGPTIFDSHGVAVREYTAPRAENYQESEPAAQNTTAQAQQAPEEQPATLLVFKDGRQMEVENYAIVGVTLFDLSGGRSRKVALADLDLTATVKQNDDRGVEFKLPAGMKMN